MEETVIKQTNKQTQSTVYYPVAKVASADLQEVFFLTQHTDLLTQDDIARVQWIDVCHRSSMYRSSMVGDLVVNDSGVYRCERIGWQRL